MNRTACLVLALVLLVAAGCCCPKTPEPRYSAVLISKLERFAVPECVAIDDPTGTPYVSNIVAPREGEGNTRYWALDGTGYLSRLKIGGEIDRKRWRESTRERPLGSPKGMAVIGNSLYVADVDHLVRYSVVEPTPGVRIEVPGAKMLNDVATDGEDLFVSDSGRARVYHLVDEAVVAEVPAPKGVNGVTFSPSGVLHAVSWDLHDVYELDRTGESDPIAFGLAEHFTALDGIEFLRDGTILVSDFRGNKVAMIDPRTRLVSTLVELTTPADIGLDRRRRLLYVPMFMADTLSVYRLEEHHEPKYEQVPD